MQSDTVKVKEWKSCVDCQGMHNAKTVHCHGPWFVMLLQCVWFWTCVAWTLKVLVQHFSICMGWLAQWSRFSQKCHMMLFFRSSYCTSGQKGTMQSFQMHFGNCIKGPLKIRAHFLQTAWHMCKHTFLARLCQATRAVMDIHLQCTFTTAALSLESIPQPYRPNLPG